MANSKGRKVTTWNNGIELISCNFDSGRAEDGTYPVQSSTTDPVQDGYVLLLDGYGVGIGAVQGAAGGGIKGIIRESVGTYQLVLREKHSFLMAAHASIMQQDTDDATQAAYVAKIVYPGLDVLENDHNVPIVRVRILNSSGVTVDLAVGSRVSVTLVLKNGGK